jgi:hypothetical protein
MCRDTTSPYPALRSKFSSFSSCSTSVEHESNASAVLPSTSEFWLQFQGFKPDPEAPFLEEFNRLAKQQRWDKSQKRSQRVAAFSAEISFHWNGSTVWDSWQALCVDVGVPVGDGVPPSVTKRKKVGGLFR